MLGFQLTHNILRNWVGIYLDSSQVFLENQMVGFFDFFISFQITYIPSLLQTYQIFTNSKLMTETLAKIVKYV